MPVMIGWSVDKMVPLLSSGSAFSVIASTTSMPDTTMPNTA